MAYDNGPSVPLGNPAWVFPVEGPPFLQCYRDKQVVEL